MCTSIVLCHDQDSRFCAREMRFPDRLIEAVRFLARHCVPKIRVTSHESCHTKGTAEFVWHFHINSSAPRNNQHPPMILQSQDSICLDMSETSMLGALEELSHLFELSIVPSRRQAPATCRPIAQEVAHHEQEVFVVSDPQRSLRTSESSSIAPRPRRFYRTFWRGVVKRALAHYTHCGINS